jgi:hypothetical protein
VTLCLQVQAALHANQTRKLPWRWSDCTRMISYSRDDLLSSMLPTYKNLLKTGVRGFCMHTYEPDAPYLLGTQLLF